MRGWQAHLERLDPLLDALYGLALRDQLLRVRVSVRVRVRVRARVRVRVRVRARARGRALTLTLALAPTSTLTRRPSGRRPSRRSGGAT